MHLKNIKLSGFKSFVDPTTVPFTKNLRFMKLGQNAGYQGWLVGFPNTGQGVVVMTNSDNGRALAQGLIYAIAKAYQWPTNGKLQDAWMVN